MVKIFEHASPTAFIFYLSSKIATGNDGLLTPWIDDRQAFRNCRLTQRLVRTDNMVDHSSLGQRSCYGKL
jgi:hypothetical protein